MIELFKKLGSFVENDAYRPKAGDIVFYDWDDSGRGDNVGSSDHVGIVESISGNVITIIEGNYSDSVKRRTIGVNGRYIRGYGVPKYDAEVIVKPTTTTKPVTTTSKVNAKVQEWQKAAMADGYKFPKYGADGQWGAECEAVAKKAICKKRLIYTNKNLTKIVQRIVGVTADGLFGKDTRTAVITYQKKNGLVADGEVGIKTWKKMLGV
jgi:peptidoglycan hydrolase-like protein with peptidoglycan-binding domain